MSIADEIYADTSGVLDVAVSKDNMSHGVPVTQVTAILDNGQSVMGTFETHTVQGFGGVDFNNHKKIGKLMSAKIKSVQKGTAEL